MNKVRTSFSLKPENVKLLNDAKGIASVSAYLDYLIERELSKKGRKQL